MQGCRGYAPSYTATQQEQLQRVLSAARAVFDEAFEPIFDRTTGGSNCAEALSSRLSSIP